MKKWIYSIFCMSMMIMQSGLFGQEGEGPPPGNLDFLQTITWIAILVIFFYLIMLRPEQKRRKKLEKQREALKKGDKVTAMGIIGTVSKVEENTVILRMVDGAKIEFLKAAVTEIVSGTEEGKKGDSDG